MSDRPNPNIRVLKKNKTSGGRGGALAGAPIANLGAGAAEPDARDESGKRVVLGSVVQVVPVVRDLTKAGDQSWKMSGVLAVVGRLDRLDDASWAATCYWTIPALDDAPDSTPRRGQWRCRTRELAVAGIVAYPVLQELGTCAQCARRYTQGRGTKCRVCGETFCGIGRCHIHLVHKEKAQVPK